MDLILWALGIGVYYFIHSLLAGDKFKNAVKRKMYNKKYYRLGYNLIAIVFLIPFFLFYDKVYAIRLFENDWLQITGAVIFIIGMLLTFVALKNYDLGEFSGIRYLGENPQAVKESLVTTGLNAWVRHPLYFASLLIFWGLFLFLPLSKILILSIISSIYLIIGARLEEQKLKATFGKAYIDYQKRVPMLIPFLKR